MATATTTEGLVLLMSQRNSARSKQETPATPELVIELNQVVRDKIPSAGGFRTLSFGLSIQGRVQIIASPLNLVITKYGAANIHLLNLEAGTLAAFANLYLLSKGYQARYIYSNTLESQNVRLLMTLALYKKD